MVRYTSQFQAKFQEFSSLYQLRLNPDNRWIQLASLLPWDEMVYIYKKKFNNTIGAPSVNPRYIIGAFVIKHKLRLSDEETLQTISENPYMQFFLGLEDYTPELLFSPTLFVEARKKLGDDTFNEFTELIIKASHPELSGKGEGQEMVR